MSSDTQIQIGSRRIRRRALRDAMTVQETDPTIIELLNKIEELEAQVAACTVIDSNCELNLIDCEKDLNFQRKEYEIKLRL